MRTLFLSMFLLFSSHSAMALSGWDPWRPNLDAEVSFSFEGRGLVGREVPHLLYYMDFLSQFLPYPWAVVSADNTKYLYTDELDKVSVAKVVTVDPQSFSGVSDEPKRFLVGLRNLKSDVVPYLERHRNGYVLYADTQITPRVVENLQESYVPSCFDELRSRLNGGPSSLVGNPPIECIEINGSVFLFFDDWGCLLTKGKGKLFITAVYWFYKP